MFDLEENLKKLPNQPGVYLMKDAQEQILYVGKAKILKNRVRQYFRGQDGLMPKIRKMVELVESFEWIVTDTEVEALILEMNLIKKHRPKYNTMLKDDKSYPYLKVTVNEEYPRVIYTRQLLRDKAKYFGPYTAAYGAQELLYFIQKHWKLCKINKNQHKKGNRACFSYHLNLCDGLCVDKITAEQHRQKIHEIIAFLNGDRAELFREMEQEMKMAAENLDFEKAAQIRDRIALMKRTFEEQIISRDSKQDADVIALEQMDDRVLAQIFFVREGKLIGREHFNIGDPENLSLPELYAVFIKQFYLGATFIPKEIVIAEETADVEILQEWLSQKKEQKVHFILPQKGEKKKLADLAKENARISLLQMGATIRKQEEAAQNAMKALVQAIGLDKNEIHRIEAYDISHISGAYSVGSMVVFIDGKAKNSDYRKFRIKEVRGVDDYAQLTEILRRRFARALEEQKQFLLKNDLPAGKFISLPDLILMDGGKGQVGVAEQVLAEFGLNIPVCGMVKDDTHSTRGLFFQGQEYQFEQFPEAFRLVTRIQDEAHRFAITYHRKLRQEHQVKSILDEIPGVGAARRKALLQHFGSAEKVGQATMEELMAVGTINKRVAEAVYLFFHPEEKKESESEMNPLLNQ
ncbi:excinuclease ABC subunit UvrC [Clostridiales bacterium COT073_COT-073]|nr:excinuclease ABC subunit UvrC [Clostridiales bacterium COT073_COT-073]